MAMGKYIQKCSRIGHNAFAKIDLSRSKGIYARTVDTSSHSTSIRIQDLVIAFIVKPKRMQLFSTMGKRMTKLIERIYFAFGQKGCN